MDNKKDTSLLPNEESPPKLWGWHTFMSLGITVVILGVLIAIVDMEKIWHEVEACDKKFIVLGVEANSCNV